MGVTGYGLRKKKEAYRLFDRVLNTLLHSIEIA